MIGCGHAVKRPHEGFRIPDVTYDESHLAAQIGRAPPFSTVDLRNKTIERSDQMTKPQQFVRDVGADESSAPGYQNSHVSAQRLSRVIRGDYCYKIFRRIGLQSQIGVSND